MSAPTMSSEQIAGPIEFTTEERQKVEDLKKLYPSPKSAIMPVLWMAQKKWGWLSTEVMKHVAEVMELPYSHVYGVASFYTMYFKKPMGAYHVQVCTNVSCMLRGGEKIYDHVARRFGIKHLERTPDGRFSLEEVECMGACGGAPMVVINEDYYENITVEELDRMLDELPDRPAAGAAAAQPKPAAAPSAAAAEPAPAPEPEAPAAEAEPVADQAPERPQPEGPTTAESAEIEQAAESHEADPSAGGQSATDEPETANTSGLGTPEDAKNNTDTAENRADEPDAPEAEQAKPNQERKNSEG